MTATDWATGAPGTGHYAEVNGINLYFETHVGPRPGQGGRGSDGTHCHRRGRPGWIPGWDS